MSYPYNSAGSFMDYFQLSYDTVDYIFDADTQAQAFSTSIDIVHETDNMNSYKYEVSESENTAYYDHSAAYQVNNVEPSSDEHRKPLENTPTLPTEQPATVLTERDGSGSTTAHRYRLQRSGRFRDPGQQVIRQDVIDPDTMTYEELLELGETVGIQSRGISPELISSLPVSKYKRRFFLRKKSRSERCVICQMEYERGDRQMTLPCNHIYHASCGAKWLAINKACPICYTEVFGDASKESRHRDSER